ncbi:MAG: AAA family ATPase [Acidobacteria bacterium]|nr:AAA family ATPase [Acidobacteriota bacterium]
MRFSTLIGHRRILTLLSRAVVRGTLPPTLLFVGPSGVGKFLVAEAVAAALNCLSPVRREGHELPFDACGVCRACDRIGRGLHVDVLRLEPDERASIKIDRVREALDRAAFRPFEGRRRVVIVREADTLEHSAQNALLKSLEEPPPGTIFILTTPVPGALLPTVVSRGMRLAFGRLTASDLAAVLVGRHGYQADDARATAALADGSPGQALALGSTDLALLRETALVLLQLAATNAPFSARLQAAAALVGGPAKKERSREDVGLILRSLASMLRDVEVLNAGAATEVLANPALLAELERVQRAFSGDRARSAFIAVDRAIAALERNAGTKVVADWLSVQL